MFLLYKLKYADKRPFCDGTHRTAEVQEKKLGIPTELWEPRISSNK